jgi:hypothetical protein
MITTMDNPTTPDIVGTGEIAERLRVGHARVRQWVQRNHLPKPDGHIGRQPWWLWTTVAEQSPPVAARIAELRRATEAEAALAGAIDTLRAQAHPDRAGTP